MVKRKIVIGLIVVTLMIVSAAYRALPGIRGTPVDQDYPALVGVEETLVNAEMPVPGFEGVEETVISEGMPVPGLENVEETVVTAGMPVPGFEGVEEMIVIQE